MQYTYSRKLINSLLWKAKQLMRYREVNYSLFESLLSLKEIFSDEIRSQNKEHYREKLKQYYLEKYNIKIPVELDPIYLEEVLVDKVYSKFLEFRAKPGEVVIDIGAQYGDFAILCAKIWKAERIYAFEPLKKNYELALKLFQLNEINNIELKNLAIGSENGFAEAEVGETMLRLLGNKVSGDIMVSAIDSMPFESVDLIKIDSEGSELEVLKGADSTILKFHPRLIIEVHSRLLKESVLRFLEERGYILLFADKPKFRPNMDLDMTQNLFLSPIKDRTLQGLK